MTRTSFKRLLAAISLSCLLGTVGCASADIDALRSQLADVQRLAQDAQQQAKAASEAAAAATTLANTAQTSADQAKTMVRTTDERLTNMSDKMQSKKKKKK